MPRAISRQSRAIEAALQAGIDACIRLGIHDDPGFSLAEVRRRELRSTLVIGMDLDREFQPCIEKLQEQRKMLLRRMPAEKFRTVRPTMSASVRPASGPAATIL